MKTEIKVHDLMKKKVYTVPLDMNAEEIAKKMKELEIGSIIVVDNNYGAKGIITERDLSWKVVAEGKKGKEVLAEQIMSAPLKTISPEIDIVEAAKDMKRKGVKRLVVLDNNGALVGLISYSDIIKVFPAILDIVEEKAKIEKY